MPSLSSLDGCPRARGFILTGAGLGFDNRTLFSRKRLILRQCFKKFNVGFRINLESICDHTTWKHVVLR